jgi:hypothetical protein
MNRLSILILLFCGCQAASASNEPTPAATHPFLLTERYVVAMESSAASAATHTDELAKIGERIAKLEAVSSVVAGQQCDILESIQAMQPKASEPPEPPKEYGNEPEATIKDNKGNQWRLDDFVAEWYRGPWTYPGEIADHLQGDHGVKVTGGMTVPDMERLHAAIHAKDEPLASAAELPTTPTFIDKQPVNQLSSNCPGGVCPVRTRSVSVTAPTFSRQWSYSRPAVTRASQRRAARGR